MGGAHSRLQVSRRRFLGAGVAAGFAPLAGRWTTRERRPNTLEIESDGGGVAVYEVTVSGSLRQADADDQVAGDRAEGHVGPDRGTDTFRYSGEITGFVLAGPATAYRNGYRVRPTLFPHPEGAPTCGDFAARPDTNRLRIESEGGGPAAYEFAVTGSVAQRDSGDEVTGRYAEGHVGPDRGADEFAFTGEVSQFALAGPASVFLNGDAVVAGSESPDSEGDRGLVPVTPTSVTARPGSLVLFEAAAPDHADEFLRTDWYVNGERRVGPGAFYGHLSGPGRMAMTHDFESAETHQVRIEAYEREASGERGAHVGTGRWTVTVAPDGNRPPSVELVAPEQPISVSSESPERRTFEVAASDPEGELDRVVWWLGQCDEVVAVSPVAGARDTASVSFAPESGCPLAVRAIDADGAVTGLDGWDVA